MAQLVVTLRAALSVLVTLRTATSLLISTTGRFQRLAKHPVLQEQWPPDVALLAVLVQVCFEKKKKLPK